MNFCKTELANAAKVADDIRTVAVELKNSLNLTASVEEVIKTLSDLIAESKDQGNVMHSSDLHNFFKMKDGKISNVLYIETRNKLLNKLTDAIFGDNPALTNAQLDAKLKFLRSKSMKKLGNSAVKLHYMYSFQKESSITSANIDNIVDYLLAYHLPLVVQSIGNDLIRLNNDKFEFDIKTDVRVDWNTDSFEEKPAKLNNAVRMMLDITPMLDANGNPVKNYKLTNNAFFFAFANLFAELEKSFGQSLKSDSKTDYIELINNPVKLVEYLSNWSSDDDSLEANIMRSFVYKWIRTKDGKLTPFAKNCLKSTDSFCYNPLNLLITSAIKYSGNTFLDRTYSGKSGKEKSIITLDRERSLWSEIGSRWIENINKEMFDILPENINDLKQEHIERILNKLFPLRSGSVLNTQESLSNWRNNFKVFYTYKNSRTSSFSEFLKQINKNNPDSFSENFYWIVRHAMNTNPYLIKGTQKNNMDKQVPVYGLRTVATSIPQQVAILKEGVLKKRKAYDLYSERNPQSKLKYHKSNFEHSSLYSGKIPIPKTVYNSSFMYDSGQDAFTKEYRDLTAKEMAHLAIYNDYLNGGGIIRIQPITVSDKPRVPMFEWVLGEINIGLEEMQTEIESYYKQTILNTLIEYDTILNLGINIPIEDVSKISWNTIQDLVNLVNTHLQKSQISVKQLWTAAEQFNKINGTNITFAGRHDFKSEKKTINGEEIEFITGLSDAMLLYTDGMNNEDFWENRFLDFLTSLKPICPEVNIKDIPMIDHINELILKIENGDLSYKKDELFKYFITHNFLAENILINTVGLPLTHKGKGNSYEVYDSAANLTMVKRMVALTATMHPCTRGLLSGAPDEINTQTVELGSKEMYTYSGNTPSGAGSTNDLDISDGIIWGVRATNNLILSSIGDVRPEGNMLKILHSELDPVKGQGRLVKCAEGIVDNAMIRTFNLNDEDAEQVGAFSPKKFMQLALKQAHLDSSSFDADEHILVDFTGNSFGLNVHKKIRNAVCRLEEISLNPESDKIVLTFKNIHTEEIISEECDKNLYSLWEAFGGAYSCDLNGNYNEGSQDAITVLMNRIGHVKKDAPVDENGERQINSQADVNQYLKNRVLFFIHTTTAQKSLQAPSSTLQESLEGKGFTVKMGIDRLGIQLNADHTAEDSHIREISQLMSNLAEGGYVSDKANKVYARIQNLIKTSLSELGIDELKLSELSEEEQAIIRTKLNKKFGQIFKRIMSNPDADVMGLANALAAELQKYNLLVPVSDRQHLSKYHTTVGSYFNKFIARAWTGRADVLMPGNNMLMVYEDVDGTVYLPGDTHFKMADDGVTVVGRENIRDYLRSLMFVDNDGLKINPDFARRYRVTKHALQPDQTYYMVNPDGYYAKYTTDTYEKLIRMSEILENNPDLILVKAYNLPRNLNAKSVGVTIDGEYHDIYFFKTHKEIMRCGIELSKLSKLKLNKAEDVVKFNAILQTNVDLFGDISNITTVTEAINKLTEVKQKKSDDFQQILTNLSSGNFTNCSSELNLSGMEHNFEISIKHDERITSNNYSHVWGKASHAEISQLKHKYFENRLTKTLSGSSEWSAIFKKESSKDIVSLYSLSGRITFCTWDIDSLKEGAVERDVILDDEGYRLDASNRRMYKWPENARLFSKNGYEVIVVKNSTQINTVLDSSYFIGYRADVENKGISATYFGSNTKDSQVLKRFIQGHAVKQYNSWLKTNHCVQARIPSQSLSFAMHLKTVGYCPWATNISICSNAHVFIQGSDFDIDKIYAMMYAIDNTGVIKQSEEYSFHVSPEPIQNMSNEDIAINDQFVNIITYALNDPKSEIFIQQTDTIKHLYNSVIEYMLGVNKMSGSSITINKSYIIDRVSNLRAVSMADLATIDSLINLLVKTLNGYSTSIFDLKTDKHGGLQNGTLDQMIDIFDDLKILMPSTSPTTMFPINDVVERRNLEAAKRNHLNPTSLWYVNQTAMVGKDGVGITASAQKAMLALTQYNSIRKSSNENFAHPTVLELPKVWQKYTHNGKVVNTEFFVNFVFPGQKLNAETLQSICDWVLTSKSVSIVKDSEGEPIINYEIDDFGKQTISSIQIKGAQFGKKGITLTIGQPIDTVLATTINSAFISSATDNAKEMKLDLIGGHPLLLPAFMYGLTLGMPVDLLVSIFTDPDVQEWVLNARGYIFLGKDTPIHISDRLSDFKLREDSDFDDFKHIFGEDEKDAIDVLKESNLSVKHMFEYTIDALSDKTKLDKKIIRKIKSSLKKEIENVTSQKKNVLNTLLKGGKALTGLSRILSINQGLKVNLGEVQQWFLHLEKEIKSLIPQYIDNYVDGYARFDAYEFFGDLRTASKEELRQYAKRREDPELAFNIIDVLATVPHYYGMCQVPLVLKSVMENQSSDIKLLHEIMSEDNRKNGFVDMKNVSKYIQAINHIKIFEFLRKLDWGYISDTTYNAYRAKKSDPEKDSALYTSMAEGIYSLKSFIETNIIQEMQKRYTVEGNISNSFLANIQKVTKPVAILGEPVKAMGISFNMTHPQNKDLATLVKLGFYEIQGEEIEGHTFGEWMFVYDLLVNHHDVANNSFTNIFDQMIDLSDPNNIVKKYYDLVINHDNTPNNIYGSEANTLIPIRFTADMDPEIMRSKKYGSPHIIPLHIDVEYRTGATSYLDTNMLQDYRRLGKLLILNC